MKSSPTFKLDDFPDTLPDDLEKLIQHGDDLDHPRGSKDARLRDRSEVVWKVATDLALLNNDPSIIAGLMLNSKLGISKTVLTKRCHQNFAIRIVQSAFENMSTGWRDVYKDGSPKQSMQNA